MLTLALAACHGGGGPRAIGNVAAPAPRVDLMAGLFAGSRPLVYEVTQVESHWDRHDPAAAPDGMVTTTTTNQVKCDLDVARLGRYRTATIECYDDGDGATVEAPVRQAFERTFGITYPSVQDTQGAIQLAMTQYVPLQAVPTTLVLDRQGRVAARILGAAEKSTLKALIDTALTEAL